MPDLTPQETVKRLSVLKEALIQLDHYGIDDGAIDAARAYLSREPEKRADGHKVKLTFDGHSPHLEIIHPEGCKSIENEQSWVENLSAEELLGGEIVLDADLHWPDDEQPLYALREPAMNAEERKRVDDACRLGPQESIKGSGGWQQFMAEGFIGNEPASESIVLDRYEIANLRSLIEAIGYPQNTEQWKQIGFSPLSVANSGDWLGQLHMKLPPSDHAPNRTPQQLAALARATGEGSLRALCRDLIATWDRHGSPGGPDQPFPYQIEKLRKLLSAKPSKE